MGRLETMGKLSGRWLLLGLALMATESMAGAIETQTVTFESGGKSIRVEKFAPGTPGRHPAVLVLHGSGGMHVGGESFRAIAKALAERGYVALVVRYFDRTGTLFSDESTNRRLFLAWLETISDAIDHAETLDDVDPQRIGLLGFSLGGYLAVTQASVDPRVGAVAEFFGGFPEPLAGGFLRMPPVLILHGDADVIVPVSEAYRLETMLKGKNVPYERKIYEGAGHLFSGGAAEDAARRTLEFFESKLTAS